MDQQGNKTMDFTNNIISFFEYNYLLNRIEAAEDLAEKYKKENQQLKKQLEITEKLFRAYQEAYCDFEGIYRTKPIFVQNEIGSEFLFRPDYLPEIESHLLQNARYEASKKLEYTVKKCVFDDHITYVYCFLGATVKKIERPPICSFVLEDIPNAQCL